MAKRRKTRGRRPEVESSTAGFAGIEVNDPVHRMLGYTYCVYGPPKVGKTTIALSWPKPIVLAYEVKGIRAFSNVPNMKIRNWKHSRKAIKILEEKKSKKKYKTVIIDTTDLMYKYCLAHCCEKYGFDHPSDQGWGKGWERVADEFLAAILELFDLGYTLVFTSHSKTSEIKADWETYTRIDPSLVGHGKRVLFPYVDVIMYMYARTTKKGNPVRTLTTKATREYEAGDRTKCLTDITLNIPPKKKDQAYKLLDNIFRANAKKM